MRLISLPFICLILTTVSVTVSAEPFFGQDGHALVASIAMTMLGVNATESCQTLLPNFNGNLTAIASWADVVVRTTAYKWSAVYHYADTPAWMCNYDRARDCHDSTGIPNACVDMAIQNYTQRLMDPSIGMDQMAEALKFLVHFVGDIHQPLHVGFTSDKGGNDESGKFLGTSNSKLHAIWDTLIIKKRIADDFAGSRTEYLSNLVSRLAPGGQYVNNLIPWLKCSPGGGDDHGRGACTVQWAQEGIGYACANAYVGADGVTRLVSGFDLQLDYYTRNLPIVEQRLVQAGVRLANVLNNIWPSASSPSFPRMSVA